MRGKTATRAATALILTWLVVPIFGEESGAALEGEIGAAGGRMSLPRRSACAPIRGEPAAFVGLHGRLAAKSPSIDESWQHRVVGEASGDVRVASMADGTGTTVTGLGRLTLGWSSRYAGARVGGWAGNVLVDERFTGWASFSIRLGLPERHLRLSFLDQPTCLPVNCVIGAEGFWTFDHFALRLGGSLGIAGYRGYLQIALPLGDGLPSLHPGIDLGVANEGPPTFSLTMAVGFSSDD